MQIRQHTQLYYYKYILSIYILYHNLFRSIYDHPQVMFEHKQTETCCDREYV
jgi:hypothetical protein